MSFLNILVFLFIHLLVPMGGVIAYLRLMAKLKSLNLSGSLDIYFFLIFFTYGGLLMVLLTDIMWKWSAIASLGTFYLLLPAPILMALTAFNNKKVKSVSKYHLFVFRAGFLYFLVLPAVLFLTFLVH